MARFSMNIRPRYSPEELDQQRHGLANGIGSALDDYLQLSDRRAQERNQFADQGIAPEPTGPSPLRRAAGAVRGMFSGHSTTEDLSRPTSIPMIDETTEDDTEPDNDWDEGNRPPQRPVTVPPVQMSHPSAPAMPRPIMPSGARRPAMMPAMTTTAPRTNGVSPGSINGRTAAPTESVSPKQNAIGSALDGALASGKPDTFVYQGTGQSFRVPTQAARERDAANRSFNAKIADEEIGDVYKGRDEARQAGYAQDLERLKPRPAAPATDRLSPAGVAAEGVIAQNAARARAANPVPVRPRQPRQSTPADAKAGEELKVSKAFQFVNRAALANPGLKGQDLMKAALKLAGSDIGRNGLDTGHFAQATTQYEDRLTSRSPYGDLFGGGADSGKRPISQAQYDAARAAGKSDAQIEAVWSIPASVTRKK